MRSIFWEKGLLTLLSGRLLFIFIFDYRLILDF